MTRQEAEAAVRHELVQSGMPGRPNRLASDIVDALEPYTAIDRVARVEALLDLYDEYRPGFALPKQIRAILRGEDADPISA